MSQGDVSGNDNYSTVTDAGNSVISPRISMAVEMWTYFGDVLQQESNPIMYQSCEEVEEEEKCTIWQSNVVKEEQYHPY